MSLAEKNWDDYVAQAEEVARCPGFRSLRDRILELAEPQPADIAVDVGAGTGLLTLPLADRVKHVWAIDISQRMVEYLRTKSASAGTGNVDVATASAVSLPLIDEAADLVVSNYCFHHLDDAGKARALAEAFRVLRPQGRLVLGDMMFRVSLSHLRDRRVVAAKVRGMLRKGPAGAIRLARNGLRFVGRRWEHPERADWWERALRDAGFVDVRVQVLDHEGGIATARRP
jgi:ubiquinone/menaquinone biosynthesis C-methylase UbiE